MEASLSYSARKLNAGAQYTFLSATYESSEVIGSGSNSTNSNALDGGAGVLDGGNITIEPGDYIPQVPQHMLKLFADYQLMRNLSVDADFSLISSSYVRGNENNLHQPDGVYFLGPGKSPGYGVVNLGARYKLSSHYELFGQIDNLLNRHYYTAGQLATTPYDSNGNFTPRPFGPIDFDGNTEFPVRSSTFLAPGAPITVFGGMKFIFGRK
jgi:outer membrane receptor protein involved in Fe transport